MILQRKIPRKTPLASKALDLLLSTPEDVTEISPTIEPTVRPPRLKPFVPYPSSTLQASSILIPQVTRNNPSEYNGEFAAKLQANVAANILASPARMDKLTRTILPSQLMIKVGLFSSFYDDGRQKILLSAVASFRDRSAGSKGYLVCNKEAFQALGIKNRWLSIIPAILATSSKSAQSTFLAPLNETINWTRKKKSNKSESAKTAKPPLIQFEYNQDLPELIPNILVQQMISFISTNLLRHHIIRLGLSIPEQQHYFVLSWLSDQSSIQDLLGDSFCTQVITIPGCLNADHSDQVYSTLVKTSKTLETKQYMKIPSTLGIQLQILLWKYKMYLD